MAEQKINNKEIDSDDQTTMISDKNSLDPGEKTLIIKKDNEKSHDKTVSVFNIEDITRKLRDEIEEIPGIDAEEMDTGQLSGIIDNIFPEKSEVERLKINRNFLQDAEPFRIERLMDDIKTRPEGLFTGFAALDQTFSMPNSAVVIITSAPRHGKSIFVLNMLLNMANIYKTHHFLFYTYEETRRDIELKAINMSGEIPFTETEGCRTNLACWKHKFRTKNSSELIDKAKSDPQYSGLKKFVEISQRIHIIDHCYQIADLIDSIHSFGNTFTIGAVIIDGFQKIKTERRRDMLAQRQCLQEVSEYIKEVAADSRLPFICTTRFTPLETGLPEYDTLSAENIEELVGSAWSANMVIGLQDYARSKFIGSNMNDNFKSKLFDHKLIKAEKIQGAFSNQDTKSVLLAKMLMNMEGIELEEELLFYRPLLRISDLTDADIQILEKNLR